MFIALSPFLVLAMGVGPSTRWKHDEPGRLAKLLWVPFVLSLVVLALVSTGLIFAGNLSVGLGLGLSAWLVLTHLVSLKERLRNKGGLGGLIGDLRNRSRSFYGMWLAHIGVAVFIVGATVVSNFGSETDLRMSPGDVHEVAGYRFQFNGAQPHDGPNYRAQRGEFVIYKGERQIDVLHPEKRSYLSGGMPMTEAGIDPGFLRDLYVSLGEPVGSQGDWAVRIYYKPYVRWIWLAAILMALGGLLAVSDGRYRTARKRARVPAGGGLARA
jgi:cytochrome c-type biogenesis protein CcmF